PRVKRIVDPDRLLDAQIARTIIWLLVAVQLDDVERELTHDAPDDVRLFIHEYADLPHLCRKRAHPVERIRIGISGTLAIEIEAYCRRAEFDCALGILAVGDSADLHEHRRRRASAGSPDFIRCSPTKNAR